MNGFVLWENQIIIMLILKMVVLLVCVIGMCYGNTIVGRTE